MTELIGGSPALRLVQERLERLLRQLGSVRHPPLVLLEGETGTGKGLVAGYLHRCGPRAQGSFVDVNCAAIPESLLEAELFGFERGAFTDARQAKPGLFQAAHGGTLFLDEVGLLPLGLQAKLLKVLEERMVRRLGSTRTTPIDVWIIAASNENLAVAVRAGRVREDFYHRVAGVVLHLPPLRERGDDIYLLAEHFVAQTCTEYGLPRKRLGADALAALRRYLWPGNVRELANVIERAVLLGDSLEVTESQLGLPGLTRAEVLPTPLGPMLRETVDRFERQQLLSALEETHWNISFAADRLGVPRNTLRYRMARYGLRPPGSPPRRGKTIESDRMLPTSLENAAAEGTLGEVRREERRHIAWLKAVLRESPEASSVETSRLHALLIDKVESFGGRVEDLGAQGIFAVFGLEPNEDAPRRAAHAGLAMCKAMSRVETPTEAGQPLIVAVHTMVGVIEEQNGILRLAAESQQAGRAELSGLTALGTSRELLATSAIAPLLERWFQLEVAPDHRYALNGAVYRILGPRLHGFAAGLARRLSPFVGRDKEIDWLQAQVRQLREGRGQVVGLVGEPGEGKSRLLYEFRQRLAGQSVTYLEGRCLSHGSGIPYLPVLDLLRRVWELEEAEAPDALSATIRRRLNDATGDPEGQAVYFLRLFGASAGTESLATLSPEALKRRTFDAIRQVILHRDGPVVLAVEDLHWVDKTSEEFFGSVVDTMPGRPLLFVSTYRAGYRPPWIDRSYVSQLALTPLSRGDSRTVVHTIVAEVVVPETVIQAIVARGEGNPFFLEELALAVAEQTKSGRQEFVPQNIGDVLAARMERLPAHLRQVLDTAAVVGRDAPVRLLDTILRSPAGLAEWLQELVQLEFLYEQPAGTWPLYSFRHALIQEVAYGRLTQAERIHLHTAAGRALEILYADRLEEVLERLAYHYGRTDQSRTAISYLTRFAEKATANYSLTEAVAASEEALLHAQRLSSDQEGETCLLRIAAQLAFPLILLGRFREVRDLLLRFIDRLDRAGEPLLSGPHYFLLAAAYDHLGEPQAALANAQRSIAEATHAGDESTAGKARVILAHTDLWAGRFRSGVENGRRAAHDLSGTREVFWIGMAHWIRGWHHMLLGEFRAADNAGEEVRRIGEASGDRRLESYGSCIAGWVAILRGELSIGIGACERAATLAPDPLAEAVVLSFLGEGYVEAGDWPQAKHRLERALDLVRQFHMPQMECWTLCRLSDVHIAEGRAEVARELASRMFLLAGQASFPLGQGLTQRVLGRAAAAVDSLDMARTSLLRALDVFTGLEAHYEIARTHLDLVRVAHRMENLDSLDVHINAAFGAFQVLDVPRWLERIDHMKAEFGKV